MPSPLPADAPSINPGISAIMPNLGAYYRKGSDFEKDKPLIIADIPGLIEGASAGKGLGIKFLRHIERTKVLIHCIASNSDDVLRDYKTVRGELEQYGEALGVKDEYILLTKSDMVDEAMLKKQITVLKKLKKPVQVVSIHNSDQLADLKKLLDKMM